MQIQPKIKTRMKLLGIKSRELAPKLGITEPNLSMMINGKTKSISYEMLGKLCEALDCQPNDLLEVPDMSSFKDVEQTTYCAPAANISQIIKTYEALLTGKDLPERIAVPTTDLQALLQAAKPVDVVSADSSMTAEEMRFENLKQMANYNGPIISFECREPYYLASCDHCGWVGSSELCGTDSFGDDSDVYCPRCHSSGADCGSVAERINCQPVDVAAAPQTNLNLICYDHEADCLSAEPAQGEQLKCIGYMDYFSMTAIKHGADFSAVTISKDKSGTHTYSIYAAPILEAGK